MCHIEVTWKRLLTITTFACRAMTKMIIAQISLIQPAKTVIELMFYCLWYSFTLFKLKRNQPTQRRTIFSHRFIYFMKTDCCWWNTKVHLSSILLDCFHTQIAMYYTLFYRLSSLQVSQEELDLEYGPLCSKPHNLLDILQLLVKQKHCSMIKWKTFSHTV